MKIKTFVTATAEDMDTVVNEFEQHNDVKATQTQHSHAVIGEQIKTMYRATVFYNERLK
jgi:hypothetical protein